MQYALPGHLMRPASPLTAIYWAGFTGFTGLPVASK